MIVQVLSPLEASTVMLYMCERCHSMPKFRSLLHIKCTSTLPGKANKTNHRLL